MNTPKWAFYTLFLAGIYNLLWGAWVILFPQFSFEVFGAEIPKYLELWQCVGMIVGVYGIGYIIASTNPNRHWPIVLVGFLGKIFGPIGFIQALYTGVFPLAFGIHNIFNDLIWIIPFYLLLRRAYDFHVDESHITPGNLIDLQDSKPTIIVALRHHGCTFTGVTLVELKKHLDSIKQKGFALKLLHMDSSNEFYEYAKKYLGDRDFWTHHPDPERKYYKSLGLERGSLLQVLGPRAFYKAIISFAKGHGIGPLRGDGFQLSGVAVLNEGKIADIYKANSASDELPFARIIEKNILF
jgi:hypothetical protein